MKKYQYISQDGKFVLENPELCSGLYLPMANESGVLSSITPDWNGDMKKDQNTFLLAPVSNEDLHNNKSSRNIWCRINGEKLWSVTGKSAAQQAELFSEQKEDTRLEGEFMSQKMTRVSKKIGIKAQLTSFVPAEQDPVECMYVVFENISEEEMRIQPVAAIPIYGRSADNLRDHRHVTSLLQRIETTDTGVIVKPTLSFDERGHQKNEIAYGVFGGSEKERPIGFFPVAEMFVGEGGSYENPGALQSRQWEMLPAGTQTEGYEAMGGIAFEECILKPGEKRTLCIVLGVQKGEEKLKETVTQYLNNTKMKEAMEKCRNYWQEKVNVRYQTGDAEFDVWMRWVSFQPILRRLFGCSFLPHHDYGKGGRGWRDLWQDCLALLMMDPSGVREMLVDNFGGVRIDGTNATIIGNGQGEFIADRNNITRVWMDHGIWPLLTTDMYIQQTGDIRMLLEETTYFKDSQVNRGEDKDEQWQPEQGNKLLTPKGKVYQGTVLEHLILQALTEFYDVGEHNHIRIRGADWNDALDLAQERGESVAFTAMYGKNLERIAELIEELVKSGVEEFELAEETEVLLSDEQEEIGKKQQLLEQYCKECRHTVSGKMISFEGANLAFRLRKKGQWVKQHIRSQEWVEDESGNGWFNGYYDNHGRAVEGVFSGQVRMMLTSQVFALMSGTASDEQKGKMIQAANQYLYEPSVGGYRLNTNFHELKMDLGRMFGFAYGHKENGAVFSHMAVMYANALYVRGEAKEGYKVIQTLFEHCSDFEKSKIYPGIPEYIDAKGRGMYPYLTGAASWLLLTVITQMYGVRGDLGNLAFYPQLLMSQFDEKKEAEVELTFAERKLHIRYINEMDKEAGKYQVVKIQINGTDYACGTNKIAREIILKLPETKEHQIAIWLG